MNCTAKRLQSPRTVICITDSAQLAATNNPNYKYKWIPNTGLSNDTIYNPKASPPDTTIYTVTVSDKTCSITKKVQIDIIHSDAGLDDTTIVCENGPTVDLFTKTIDAPSGGSWRTPTFAPFTNPYNPPVHSPGNYLYIVSENGCPPDTSIMVVKEILLPNAGVDGKDTICKGTTGFNLFGVITSEPSGGTWSGPGSVNATTGILNASSLATGNYTYNYVVKGATPCPNDTSQAFINIKPLPTASFPAVAPFCPNTTAYLKPVFTGVSPFSLTFTNGSVSTTVNNLRPGDSIAITPTTSPTTYTITSVIDGGNYPCTNTVTSSQTVTWYTLPVASLDSLVCNSTNSGYTAHLSFSGGHAPSYQLNGAPISGTTYVSPVLPAGSTYTFVFTDKNGCAPLSTLTGSKNCNCGTDAGTMLMTPLSVCENATFSGTHNTSSMTLDGNDVVNFILHTSSGTSLGTIISKNPSAPIFTYNPNWGVQFEVPYYISAVAGDEDPNNPGFVDLSNPNGCMSVSAGQQVVFHRNPLATAVLNPTQVCLGDPTQLVFSFQAGIEPFSFALTGYPDITGKTPASNTHSLTPASLGNTTYTLTRVTEKNGCSSPLNISLTVTTVDEPVVSGTTITCNNTSTQYQVYFNISNGDMNSYRVNGVLTTGAYTSGWINSGSTQPFFVSDTNHCGDTTVIISHTCPCITKAGTMSQSPGSPVNEVCSYSPFTATHNGDQVLDGNDTLSFILCSDYNNPIATQVQYRTTPSFQYDSTRMTPGTVYYVCPIADDKDPLTGMVDLGNPTVCQDITSGTPVRFIAPPLVTVSGTADICMGDFTDIELTFTGNGTVSSTLTGSDGFSQNVSGPGGSTNLFKVKPNPVSGKGLVTYTLSSPQDGTSPTACNGKSSGTANILVHPIPTASLNGASFVLCQGESIPLPVTTTGDGSLTAYLSYSGINFDSFTDAAGTTTIKTPSSLAPGNYTFKVDSIRDNTPARCFAVGTGTNTVRINATPNVSGFVTNPNPALLCSGEPVTLIFTGSGNDPKTLYYHNNVGGKFAHANWNGTIDSITFIPDVGTITYTLDSIHDGTLSSATGGACRNTVSLSNTVTVNPLPTANISGDTSVCRGQEFTLKLAHTGAAPFTTVFIDNKTGVSYSKIYSAINDVSDPLSPDSTTWYTLVSARDNNGCEARASDLTGQANVTIFDIPQTHFTASQYYSCPPLVTNFFHDIPAQFFGSKSSWKWDFGNGNTFSSTGPVVDPRGLVYDKPKTYNVKLDFTSNDGCFKSFDTLVVVNPFPKADFDWVKPVTTLEPTVLIVNNSEGDVDTTEWTVYDVNHNVIHYQINSPAENLTFTFPSQDSGTYYINLVATTNKGCKDETPQLLFVNGAFEIYAPNTFTPNGDGVNEGFRPILLGENPDSYELIIFNRWGQMIFKTNEYNAYWDGTFNGEKCKEDVYLYKVTARSKYDAEKRSVLGQIRVLR